jgi:hypothetical protein
LEWTEWTGVDGVDLVDGSGLLEDSEERHSLLQHSAAFEHEHDFVSAYAFRRRIVSRGLVASAVSRSWPRPTS